MGIALSELARNTRTITVEYNGETFDVTYRPSNLTSKKVETMASGITKEEAADFFQDLVVEWDLWDKPKSKGGHQLPVSIETLESIPTSMTNAIASALVNDDGSKGNESDGNVTPLGNRSTGGKKTRTRSNAS